VIPSAVSHIFYKNRAWQILLVGLWVLAVFYLMDPIAEEYKFVTLHKILKTNRMTVITRNYAHCYYIYRDEPMGFEYELAREFADYLGVELGVNITEHWEDMIPALRNGSGAFIAAGLTITPGRQMQAAFSNGYMDIRQHVISRRNSKKIKKPEDLSGKTVHVQSASAYQERLEELRKQGIPVNIRLHRDLPAEELLQRVARGEIRYTVVDSNIALLSRRHFPDAIMAGAISDQQQLGWALHPKARKLKAKIDAFFSIIKENGKFDEIYDKYYGDVASFDYVDLSIFHRRIKTRLSRYSPFIKVAAKKHGFDWRLISAQIYQESHLDPWAKSRAGAKGLMQLLPSTARSLGVNDIYNPVENINAGVLHLKKLYDSFSSAKGDDRLLLALAAYNVGQGHIGDARRLAIKMNLDPNSWESLKKTLPLLSYRKYYKNAKYGYCRGAEPVLYIKQIMIYYDILKQKGVESGQNQAKL
jgi:membrane-bound lytic murein transglycosylase F